MVAYSFPVISIRLAVEADAPALRSIAVAAYQHYVPRIGREPAPVAADYIARRGQVADFIILVPQPGSLLLENVAVLPPAQGHGVGTRLLALADERARSLHLPEVRLYTNEAMTENLAYYPRRGYTETHRAQQDGFRRVFFPQAAGHLTPQSRQKHFGWPSKVRAADSVAAAARRHHEPVAVVSGTVTLWRPTGPEELALVAASGWREWPPRLPGQPIFYPVLNEEYAAKIARDWNVPYSGAGYVTRFQVLRSFLDQYEVHQVGGKTILGYWIPAEELPALNASIVGTPEATAEYHCLRCQVW